MTEMFIASTPRPAAEVWRFIGADWVGSSPALAPELGLLFIGLEFAVEGQAGQHRRAQPGTTAKKYGST